MEESPEEHFPGSDQEGGGEEDDGAADDGRHLHLPQEEKHQDIQRDSRRQVGETESCVPPVKCAGENKPADNYSTVGPPQEGS